MKKVLKKVSAMLLTTVMAISMMACGNTQTNEEAAEQGSSSVDSTQVETIGKASTIGIAFYQDTGLAVDATKAYLEGMSEDLNVTFKYTVLTQMDEATNIQKIQELISSGVDGIICTMDLGFSSILAECEAANVYIGGYLSDYDISYHNAYDTVFQSDYFVGTVADGQLPDDVTIGTTMFESLLEYNERNADAPITHVSMAIFPDWAFPSQKIAADQFVAAVDEYNKTAEIQIRVDSLNEETDVLQFAPMDTTYFAKHEGTQAIMSFAAGTAFVYPTMVAAGVDKEIKLFTSGFDGGEEANFGSKGNATYQQTAITAPESITFPLVLLLNKINGVEFADQPEDAERLSASQFILNSDEDMDIFSNTLFFTSDAQKAMFTGQDVLHMTAYANPDATYADLKDKLGKMTIDDVK